MAKKARRVVGLAPGQPSYRILVVDDKFENRHLLLKLLKSTGFEVAEAENGQEALDKWETWEPQLIWMDMRMPVMDGFEATKRIEATIKGQATVVIALTASVFEHDRNIISLTGCDGFVAKPFREADIFDNIAKHLGAKFVYDDQQVEAMSSLQPKKLAMNATTLSSQPESWRQMVRGAAEQGDAEGLYALIGSLPESESLIKSGLTDMVKSYRFDLILELVDQAKAAS